ncbi:MAG: bacterial Ig-like domain-containing protein [Streptococcaceae bacterium]|jgi:uncharacterized protein YkwD|nr:bacterial Ig-like domain-containing protein [Streptococcaceae bacterium]
MKHHNATQLTKETNFRTWKSGKNWLYTAGLAVTLAGGSILSQTAHADVTDTTTQVETSLSSLASQTPDSQLAALATEASTEAMQSTVSENAALSSLTSAATSQAAAPAASQTSSSLATSQALSTVEEAKTLAGDSSAVTTGSTASSVLSAFDVSSLASQLGSAYTTTLGSDVSNLLSAYGVQTVMSMITTVMSDVTPYLSVVPGASDILSTINAMISGINTVVNMGSDVLGAIGLNVNSMVASVINTGLNTIGTLVQPTVDSLLSQVPLVGSALAGILDPILSNITGTSPAAVVSDIANSVGLGSALSALTNFIQSAAPETLAVLQTVVNGVTDAINTVMNIANTIGSYLAPIGNFLAGLLAPIQNIISSIENTIENALGLGSSSAASSSAASSSASSSSATSSSSSAAGSSSASSVTNIATSSTSQAATSDADIITINNTTLPYGTAWKASDNIVSATDNGTSISLSSIGYSGTVIPTRSGTYVVIYYFTDSQGVLVQQPATVTVLPQTSTTQNALTVDSTTSGPEATLGKEQIVTKNTILAKGQAFKVSDNFVSATDSKGNAVAASDITITGAAIPSRPGSYALSFTFTDPYTNDIVQSLATVTVLATDSTTAQSSATAELSQANATLANLVSSAVAAGTGTVSNPTASFTSTTNWPSSSMVVLEAPTSSFVPDITQINSYFISYVNELREANGQSDLTYSSSEQSFAQTRATAIVADFSHSGAGTSSEDIGASGGLVDQFQSNQEIAYYLVMDWYDETDNLDASGAADHYGHRANLLYSGPTAGIGYVQLATPVTTGDNAGYDTFWAYEAPAYTDQTLYNEAQAMADSTTPPNTTPLPKLTFVYVDAATYAAYQTAQQQATAAQDTLNQLSSTSTANA